MAVHRRDPNPAGKVQGGASGEGWTDADSRVVTIMLAIGFSALAVGTFLYGGLWLPFILIMLHVGRILVVGGRRANPWLPDHPVFHDLFEVPAARKHFTFTYFTLLAFVAMGSVAVWGGVKVRACFPHEPWVLVVYAGLSLAFILTASLVVEYLQMPSEKKEAEKPRPRRKRTRRGSRA